MKRLLALLMAMAMVFAFAACGDDAAEKKDSKDVETPAVEEEIIIEEEPELDDDADAAVAELAAMMNEQLGTAMENDVLSAEVLSEGTTVIYRYTYKNLLGATEEVAAALEEQIDANAAAFESDLKAQQNEVPAVSALAVEYYDADGTLIYERTFK